MQNYAIGVVVATSSVAVVVAVAATTVITTEKCPENSNCFSRTLKNAALTTSTIGTAKSAPRSAAILAKYCITKFILASCMGPAVVHYMTSAEIAIMKSCFVASAAMVVVIDDTAITTITIVTTVVGTF